MSVTRVLIVNTNTERKPYPVPPLGACLLSAMVEKNFEVMIYDATFRGARDLAGTVEEFRPDCVALSLRNIDDMDMLRPTSYVDAIRDDFVDPIRGVSRAPVILGGSAFSIMPGHFMRHYGAEYGIRGEGEFLFPLLLRCLDAGGDPRAVPGIIVGDAQPAETPAGWCLMDELPFSEIDLKIDYGPYRERGAYPVQTKRGCAHRCVYCTYPCIEGARYRLRSPEGIADEIEAAAARLGDVTFEFVDSTFNDPPGHAEAVCRELARRGLGLRLRTMGINPSHVSPALLEGMIAAGFAQIDCTPDVASAAML